MTPLEEARDAAARGDQARAYELLKKVLATSPTVGAGVGHPPTTDRPDDAPPPAFDDLTLLAGLAYSRGDLDTTFEAWERAHATAVEHDDAAAAAMAAARIGMHLIMDTGLMAPVRAWVKRAERLLDGHGEVPAHAWIALDRTYERLLSGDFPAARDWARRAVDIGARQREATPRAMGQVAEARSLILQGEMETGLELLDDAAAVTLSGEVDPLSVGLIYCELICAWQALAQYDRAEELTEAMERWCRQHAALGSVHGRCRVHRAEILRQRGPCDEAEDQAQLACEELRPILRREFGWPLTELGLTRLQRGDLAGAEAAFLEAHEAGWEPQPGLALLRLAQGDIAGAAASISEALEHPLEIPSKELPPNTELRRAPLLAAQVEISVTRGELEQAGMAAEELTRIAERFASRALQATAAHSTGMVQLALHDPDAARTSFDRSLRIFSELAVPYEAARARLGLARTYAAAGEPARAALEYETAASTFERIGAHHRATEARRAASGRAVPAPPVSGEDAAWPTGPADDTARSADPADDADTPATGPVGTFRAEGDYWVLGFADHLVHLRDLKGLRYLARLLSTPDRELHVLDLVATEQGLAAATPADPGPGLSSSDGGDAGPLLDARAKEAYRRRLEEIEQDIEEATAFGDHERAARAAMDRDFLVRELSRAVGLGGRDRRAGSAAERARVSVTRAIRHALGRIREQHPELGAHLEHAVQTGTYCAYRPDPTTSVSWRL